ncbi:MAG: internal scaffolding protein [Microvirus sp.]|nr:MAG: internal scaffolding protein [Microvirus sp.]
MIKWRQQYDTKRDAEERALTDIACQDPSMTQQHFTEDADVNVIARRFGLDKTGVKLPIVPTDPRYYGDFSEPMDLRTALDRVRDAENRFMDLPAKLRARFNNKPAELWTFINDPDNGPEAIKLGLLKEPKVPENKTPPAT